MNKSLSEEILNRLQFITTVALFFTAVLNNFYNIYSKENSDKAVLQFSVVILAYFFCYIFFDLFKGKINLFWLKVTNVLTFCGLFSFIPLLMLFISGKNPEIAGINLLLLKLSIIS
jgi:hypothetical protein